MADANAPLLSLRGLTRRFGGLTAVDGIDLDLAQGGLVSIIASNASPWVAPYGATEGRLGTNPICFGFPSAEEPIILDIGTSAIIQRTRSDCQFPADQVLTVCAPSPTFQRASDATCPDSARRRVTRLSGGGASCRACHRKVRLTRDPSLRSRRSNS